jgi:hypothetical protein
MRPADYYTHPLLPDVAAIRHKMKHTNLKPHIPLSHPLLKKKKIPHKISKEINPAGVEA